MPGGRPTGSKNRNYPPLRLSDALQVATVIQDEASGMAVSRLTLADLLKVSPASSNLRELVAASRFYGLTTGGINADEFGLDELGAEATGADEIARTEAYKKAVLRVQPYRTFFETFSNKKVPGSTAFREFLVKHAAVPEGRVEECMEFILADAETAGFVRPMKGGSYIDLAGVPTMAPADAEGEGDGDGAAVDAPSGEEVAVAGQDQSASRPSATQSAGAPKKVFIAHGRSRAPLEQLKAALDTLKVSYAVAVDAANQGRPISRKVANLMRDECSSGIFIFTADEMFSREDGKGNIEEVWRPSENVVYELGAASILYENRIVIFKEKGVTFPSDFSDLGYIEFEKDQLGSELGSLVKELVALDILEVRAKG